VIALTPGSVQLGLVQMTSGVHTVGHHHVLRRRAKPRFHNAENCSDGTGCSQPVLLCNRVARMGACCLSQEMWLLHTVWRAISPGERALSFRGQSADGEFRNVASPSPARILACSASHHATLPNMKRDRDAMVASLLVRLAPSSLTLIRHSSKAVTARH
jgi:hypothetical protein